MLLSVLFGLLLLAMLLVLLFSLGYQIKIKAELQCPPRLSVEITHASQHQLTEETADYTIVEDIEKNQSDGFRDEPDIPSYNHESFAEAYPVEDDGLIRATVYPAFPTTAGLHEEEEGGDAISSNEPPVHHNDGEEAEAIIAQDPLVSNNFQICQEDLDACRSHRARNALQTFYQRLNELQQYREEHGNANVPQRYEPNRALGNWVNKMRNEKRRFDRGEASSLTAKKIGLLIDVGFQWGRSRGDAWEDKYRKLQAYKEEHGNCNVPTRGGDTQDVRQLGRWVSRQRELYRLSQTGNGNPETRRAIMPQDRFLRLALLGFQWSAMPSAAPGDDEEDEDNEEES